MALIRPATSDDVPILEEFIRPFVEAGKLLPRTAAELDELIRHGFVAEVDRPASSRAAHRIVGFAALEIYSSKLGEIRSLAVSPQMQGQGIGQRLVEACVNRAYEKNVLEVMVITSAEEFFKTCGFDFTLPGERKALFLQTRDS